ncbi:hypothetical protein PVK06_020748 [Gossypium arboreum]|uniref:Photosystem II CP47 reaction center protein n=1 Tax=Gossypium arboreum TaxID=29729 RepID=A0ABR0PN79_GOSAR|nr:hypothetical protein PVK06_020748 [Gossypium arboreum]
MGLPWYRVHTVVLNDPGRLLSVHIMHTALVAGWAGSMALYELVVFDPSGPVLDPMWGQDSRQLKGSSDQSRGTKGGLITHSGRTPEYRTMNEESRARKGKAYWQVIMRPQFLTGRDTKGLRPSIPWIDREGGQSFWFFHVVKELNNGFFVLSKS